MNPSNSRVSAAFVFSFCTNLQSSSQPGGNSSDWKHKRRPTKVNTQESPEDSQITTSAKYVGDGRLETHGFDDVEKVHESSLIGMQKSFQCMWPLQEGNKIPGRVQQINVFLCSTDCWYLRTSKEYLLPGPARECEQQKRTSPKTNPIEPLK